jgi:hypothetical protein
MVAGLLASIGVILNAVGGFVTKVVTTVLPF